MSVLPPSLPIQTPYEFVFFRTLYLFSIPLQWPSLGALEMGVSADECLPFLLKDCRRNTPTNQPTVIT
jgi:hypothetical protein